MTAGCLVFFGTFIRFFLGLLSGFGAGGAGNAIRAAFSPYWRCWLRQPCLLFCLLAVLVGSTGACKRLAVLVLQQYSLNCSNPANFIMILTH
jgi:hypothetical protein